MSFVFGKKEERENGIVLTRQEIKARWKLSIEEKKAIPKVNDSQIKPLYTAFRRDVLERHSKRSSLFHLLRFRG